MLVLQTHAIADEAHKNKLKVAAHIFYLNDAKALVKAGIDVIAHSVRDQPVDAEFINAMKVNKVVYIPTLDLDESQFVYAEQPAWMKEPFFTRAVDAALWNAGRARCRPRRCRLTRIRQRTKRRLRWANATSKSFLMRV